VAELRNNVYRHVFVARDGINFDRPTNCDRSAAFLRTCKTVHQEGCSVLYSENQFKFVRNKSPRNPFWSNQTNEVGYLDMRHFLSMIGPISLTYLRSIHIVFDDAPKAYAHLYEDPRFVHDPNLLASLKIIAKHCFLNKIQLAFLGRRNVTTFDVRFLEHMCAIQADVIEFNANGQYWHGDKYEARVRDLLKSEMVRLEPLYDKPEKRVKKKGRNSA
jgi:hypothetical protein